MVRFENVEVERNFVYFNYSIEEIEKQDFIKINLIDVKSNLFISLYKKYTADLEDFLNSLEQCSSFDKYLFIVYNKGKIKFDLDITR